MSDKKKAPLTDVQGRPVVAEQGFAVTDPRYVNSLPWIERERLGWEKFQEHCAKEGLPAPTPLQWWETFGLTDAELANLLALQETQVGDMFELSDYFIIRRLGNKPRICWREPGQPIGQMTFGDFRNAYKEYTVQCGYDDNGVPKFAPMAEVWITAKKTRRFKRAKFLPGQMTWQYDSDIYNLWEGWPEGLPRKRDLKPPLLGRVVEGDDLDGPAEPEECSLFLDHMRYSMCQDNDEVYEYLLGWMAEGLLRPGRSQVALAMTGPSGSGKGTFASLYGSFFGHHYLPISDKERLVGKFNRQLMETQVVYADEVDFATANEATKRLRSLVTEEKIQIEFKGIDPTTEPKWFRIMLSSNEEHIISALKDDRRFLVLRVDSGEHNDDEEGYFRPMRLQWEAGGRVALFRWLTGRYWTEMLKQGGWKVGDRPVTEALRDQKDMSLPPELMIIQNMLMDGEPPCDFISDDDGMFVPIRLMIEAARLKPDQEKAFTEALKETSSDSAARAKGRRILIHGKSRLLKGRLMPTLAEARKNWEAYVKRPVPWPSDVVTWVSDSDGPTADLAQEGPEPEDLPF